MSSKVFWLFQSATNFNGRAPAAINAWRSTTGVQALPNAAMGATNKTAIKWATKRATVRPTMTGTVRTGMYAHLVSSPCSRRRLRDSNKRSRTVVLGAIITTMVTLIKEEISSGTHRFSRMVTDTAASNKDSSASSSSSRTIMFRKLLSRSRRIKGWNLAMPDPCSNVST